MDNPREAAISLIDWVGRYQSIRSVLHWLAENWGVSAVSVVISGGWAVWAPLLRVVAMSVAVISVVALLAGLFYRRYSPSVAVTLQNESHGDRAKIYAVVTSDESTPLRFIAQLCDVDREECDNLRWEPDGKQTMELKPDSPERFELLSYFLNPDITVARIGRYKDVGEIDDWRVLGINGSGSYRDVKLTIYSENDNTTKFNEEFTITVNGIQNVGPLVKDRTEK